MWLTQIEKQGIDEIMGTAIVGTLVFIAVILAARSIVRYKKAGKSLQCGGDCSNCNKGCH